MFMPDCDIEILCFFGQFIVGLSICGSGMFVVLVQSNKILQGFKGINFGWKNIFRNSVGAVIEWLRVWCIHFKLETQCRRRIG